MVKHKLTDMCLKSLEPSDKQYVISDGENLHKPNSGAIRRVNRLFSRISIN